MVFGGQISSVEGISVWGTVPGGQFLEPPDLCPANNQEGSSRSLPQFLKAGDRNAAAMAFRASPTIGGDLFLGIERVLPRS